MNHAINFLDFIVKLYGLVILLNFVIILWPEPSYESLEYIEGTLTTIESSGKSSWRLRIRNGESENTIYFDKENCADLVDYISVGEKIEIKLNKGFSGYKGYELAKSNVIIVPFFEPKNLKTKFNELAKLAACWGFAALLLIFARMYKRNDDKLA